MTAADSPPESRREPDRSERVIAFRLRSVLSVLGLIGGLGLLVGFVFVAHHALVLIAIALFFALALNPVVLFFERRGLSRRLAVAAVFTLAVALAALLGFVFVPPLVTEVTKFVHAAPGLVSRITHGQGALGHLASRYHVVEHVKSLTSGSGGGGLGAARPVLSALSGAVGTAVGAVVVAFLTLLMLIEGRDWRARILDLVPTASQPRWQRIGTGIYKAVGGFVAGNLLASVVAGLVALVALLVAGLPFPAPVAGLPFPAPVALLVVLLELVPYVGPVLTTVILGVLGLVDGVLVALAIVAFFTVYHVVEGHTLRPMIYGRALNLSTLTILIAIILGIETAGILGALAAIPVAGAIQVVVREILLERRRRQGLAQQADGNGAAAVAHLPASVPPPLRPRAS